MLVTTQISEIAGLLARGTSCHGAAQTLSVCACERMQAVLLHVCAYACACAYYMGAQVRTEGGTSVTRFSPSTMVRKLCERS